MKLERVFPLDNEYEGYFADIGSPVEFDEHGVVLVVVDIYQSIDTENLNIIPCKLMRANNQYFEWLLREKHLVVKKFNFIQ